MNKLAKGVRGRIGIRWLPLLLLSLLLCRNAVRAERTVERSPDAEEGDRLLARLNGSSGACVSFSADGKWLLTAGVTEFRVWDAVHYKPVTPPVPLGGRVSTAQLSPDGKRVLTAGEFGVRLWDAASGEPLLPNQFTNGKGGGAHRVSACFSPDGSRLLTWNADERARLWDTATGKLLLDLPHETRCRFAAFSPNGKRILTVAHGSAFVRDAETGKVLFRDRRVGEADRPAAFSPDGKLLALAGIQEIYVVAADSGKDRADTRAFNPGKDSGYVQAVLFSPDGESILTLTNSFLRVWDARNGKPLTDEIGNGTIDAATFTPDGKRFVCNGLRGVAGFWSVALRKRIAGAGPAPHHLFWVAAFTSDGRRVALGYPHGAGKTLIYSVGQ